MNLATRCTECGTVFRVVQDQLKVSEGWVRCGRCTAVFNAQAQLFDLDAPAPADASPPSAPPAAPPAMHWAEPAAGTAQAPARNDPDDWSPTLPVQDNPRDFDPVQDAGPGVDADDPPPEADQVGDLAAGPMPPSSASPSRLIPETDPALHDVPLSTEGTRDVIIDIGEAPAPLRSSTDQMDADEAIPTPSFMRTGNTDRPLARPAVLRGLLAAAMLLVLALLLQGTVVWRDQIAAHAPAARPALAALCQALDCKLSPLRRIDRLAVETSGLTRIDGAPLHRLSLTLRNRADTVVMVPALDLSVTDAQGRLVARKVLQMADLGITATAIDAGAELPLQALLNTGEIRVAGYTVELFYP